LHYIVRIDAGLVSCPLPVTQNAELRFRHRYDLEEAGPGEAYDGAVAEMSVAGGAWQTITPVGGYPAVMTAFSGTPLAPGSPVYTGRSSGWDTGDFESAIFPLPGLDSTTVQFRLRMVSDGYIGAGGWLVDDFELHMDPPGVDVAGPPLASRLRFLTPEPNPSRGRIRFAAELPQSAELRLEIFDIRGRRVATPFAGQASAGPWNLLWNPLEDRSSPNLAAGVYLARLALLLEDGSSDHLSRRFVVLR
jgi:hypothetical protein